MRLIDADTINYQMLYKENYLQGTGHEAQAVWKSDIDKMPTIDAVPVVRCKDCTEFSDDDEEDGWGFCNNTGVGMERDGFCSCGERKDDADE